MKHLQMRWRRWLAASIMQKQISKTRLPRSIHSSRNNTISTSPTRRPRLGTKTNHATKWIIMNERTIDSKVDSISNRNKFYIIFCFCNLKGYNNSSRRTWATCLASRVYAARSTNWRLSRSTRFFRNVWWKTVANQILYTKWTFL